MRSDIDEQLALTREVVEVNVQHGDHPSEPRQIDHAAAFRSRTAARAAAAELEAAGYRVDAVRRHWLTVWLEFSKQTAVDHGSAAAFTREVVGVVHRHGGRYDGWGGFLVAADD
jgi:regulator of RNase E activity RraB